MTIFQPPPTYADPVLVDEKTGKGQFNPIWLKWFLDITQYINSNGGSTSTIQHNSLGGLQGGNSATSEFYHLTSVSYSYLVNGVTGSGPIVLQTSPTIITPILNGTVAGTGVSQSSSASTLVQRDANGNAFSNDFIVGSTSTVTAAGTTTLTAASTAVQVFTGSSSQTLVLPDATTLTNGKRYWVNNNSSGSITVKSNGGTTIYTFPAGGYGQINLISNSTSAGTWDVHPLAPSTVTWGSGVTGLVFNTALSTTPSISAGASSAANPSFIPQRGSSTTGYGGDGTHLYGSIGGTAVYTATTTGFNIPTGSTYQINGVQISAANLSNGTTGSGSVVLATSPTLTTPNLGTPSALVGTNITGTASGLTSGIATNIAGGSAGSLPYQSGAATTALLSIVANKKLFANAAGNAPEWSAGFGILNETRDSSLATGNVSYIGLGFKPSTVLMLCSTAGANGSWSVGFYDGTHYTVMYTNEVPNTQINTSNVGVVGTAAGNTLITISSFDTDGITLTYTKSSSPTGIISVSMMLFR